MTTLLAHIAQDLDLAIRAALCPGCEAKLPDSKNDSGVYVHALPRTTFTMDCSAMHYRKAHEDAVAAAETAHEAGVIEAASNQT